MIEDQVKLDKRYETLFLGLRLNTENNSAVTQPILYCLRRILYALVIVYMSHMPLIGISAMIIAVMIYLAFVIQEKPWKDSLVNTQHIINEAGLYLALIFLVTFKAVGDINVRDPLGYGFIALICLLVAYNMLIIVFDAIRYIKNLIKAKKLKRKRVRVGDASKLQAFAAVQDTERATTQRPTEEKADEMEKPDTNGLCIGTADIMIRMSEDDNKSQNS